MMSITVYSTYTTKLVLTLEALLTGYGRASLMTDFPTLCNYNRIMERKLNRIILLRMKGKYLTE